MSAAEFSFWGWYRGQYGIPSDRIEAGVAIAGAAVCQTRGAKVKPSDLLPKFATPAESGDVIQRLGSWLSGIRGVKIRRIPKDGEPFEIKGPERKQKPKREPRAATKRRVN